MEPSTKRVRKPGQERWPTRGMYVAVAVALTTGPAMLWRFPALALKHGGGTFLLAWIVALVITGLPLIVLETALGQRWQRAAPRALRGVNRKWEWLGWTGPSLGYMLVCLQAVLATWALVFAGHALQTLTSANGEGANLPWRNPTRFIWTTLHGTETGGGWALPPIGVLLVLAGVWAAIGFLAASGPRLFGAVLRVTLGASVIAMLVFVVRQLLFLADPALGAAHGLGFALDVSLAGFGKAGLWIDAFTHALLACGVGLGAHVVLAAYLPKEADTANNGLFVGLCGGTLTFIVWIAFAIMIGTLALHDGRLVGEMGAGQGVDGIGVLLVIVPMGMLQTDATADPVALQAFMAMAFWLALAGLAIAHSVILLHAGIGAARERLARSRRRIGAILTGAGFVASLAFAGVVGWQWVNVFDQLVVRYGLLIVALLECVSLGWIAGTSVLRHQINRVSERPVGLFWEITVRVLTPLILAVLLLNALTGG